MSAQKQFEVPAETMEKLETLARDIQLARVHLNGLETAYNGIIDATRAAFGLDDSWVIVNGKFVQKANSKQGG